MSSAAMQMQGKLESIAAGVDGALGIVVEDLTGKSRFAVNADRQFTQASAIKIPILLEVFKQAHEGKLTLADRRWVDKANKTAGSGILFELGDHTVEVSVEDLCTLMIVLSDNTATNMLIDQIGMQNVTATMASLECPQTLLQRRMMDTAAAARGEENLSTPADAARILRLLHAGQFINREVSDHALSILRKEKPGAVKSTVPAGVPVAFKPGGIPGVLTEWAIVELPDRPYVVVMMGTYNQDEDALDDAMKEVAKGAYEFFVAAKSQKVP